MKPYIDDGATDWLERRAQLTPDRVALIEANTRQTITYAVWNRRADEVARALCALGMHVGDRVAVLAMNSLEYLDILFACQKGGFVLQALNWRLSADELIRLIEDATPRIMFYSAEYVDKIQCIYHHTQMEISHAIFLGEAPMLPKHLSWHTFLHHAKMVPSLPTAHPALDAPWMLCYTGGTTGLPKAAILTHRTVTWNAINTIISWGITANDMTFLNLPLFHTGGLNVFTTPFVYVGACSIVCQSFDVDQVFDLLHEYPITTFVGVPTMLIMMQQHPRWHDTSFDTCNVVFSGGASCPIPVIERFFEKGVCFKTGYGLTEAGPNTFCMPDADVRRKIGSVGFPLFHIHIRIVNEEGNECALDEVGELCIRGPHVIPGYWNNPGATSKTIVDGWLHTGDLASRDSEGYVSIAGRIKDMIISGGENIYPAEIESILLGHAAVAEVAIIGVSDATWGEVGRAIVVLQPGIHVNAADLLDYVRQRLAHYKVPKSVVFVKQIPKTGAGKIDKKQLVAQYGGNNP